MRRRSFLKRAGLALLDAASLPSLGHLFPKEAHAAGAAHVRWDIIHVIPSPPQAGSHLSAGGEAFAFASNPSTAEIRLTGSGTFVAPASGGGSGAVTGGGQWQTLGAGLPAASGSYRVTRLVSWVFANMQTNPLGFVDEIGDINMRANGTAMVAIAYDDGSDGVLGVGCHGPGAPNGILEGVIATKGYVTYWNAETGVSTDRDRTIFHLLS
jgi:hypothetical protein